MARDHFSKRGHHRRYQTEEKIPQTQCPLCEKPIRDIHTALFHGHSKKTAHFDCVTKDIRKNEELKENESICYLGKGSFGILVFRSAPNSLRFLIRKRIQYEDRDEFLEWKKSKS